MVLGNHDLHLLAVAYGGQRKLRDDDTLDAVLEARDREPLLEWLLHRPLAWQDPAQPGELMVHAGLVPQWRAADVLRLAREVERELRRDPAGVFLQMYGNRPDRWDEALSGAERRRFIINVLTRMRYCSPDGTIDLKLKGRPGSQPAPWQPWFDVAGRAPARRCAWSSATGRRWGCWSVRTCWPWTLAASGAARSPRSRSRMDGAGRNPAATIRRRARAGTDPRTRRSPACRAGRRRAPVRGPAAARRRR